MRNSNRIRGEERRKIGNRAESEGREERETRKKDVKGELRIKIGNREENGH